MFYSCLPLSKVECLLQLPSLDVVFSTQRSDIDGTLAMTQSQADSPPPFPKSRGQYGRTCAM